MANVEDFDVIHAMRKFGGGFVSRLAEAAQRADLENLRRIKATWPEYWAQYEEMAASQIKRVGIDAWRAS